jgi:hypothetical protein
MNIRAPKDFWSGLIFVVVGLSFVAMAGGYRIGDMHRLGPGMFPMLVGGLMAALGLVLAGRAFAIDGEPIARFQARPIGVGLLGIMVFGLLLRPFGLVLAIVALVCVSALAGKQFKAIETLILAIVLAGLSVVVFVWIVGMPLPLWPEW